MKIAIRLDVGGRFGFGHWSRMVTLARTLANDQSSNYTTEIVLSAESTVPSQTVRYVPPSVQVRLVDRPNDLLLSSARRGELRAVIFDIKKLPQDDLLGALRSAEVQLIFIDCMPLPTAASDLIIYPNCHNDLPSKPDQFLDGLDVTLLGSVVYQLEGQVPRWDLSMTTGGTDPAGVMLKAASVFCDPVFSGRNICLLPGNSMVHRRELDQLRFPENVKIREFNYDDLTASKKVITTFGVTVYELLFLGADFGIVSHSKENHLGSLNLLKRLPSVTYFGCAEQWDPHAFNQQLRSFFNAKPQGRDFRPQMLNAPANVVTQILSRLN